MKTIIMTCVCIAASFMVMTCNAAAGKVVVRPVKIAQIADNEESADTRLLIFFELPDELLNSKAIVDFALLKCEAEISGSVAGQIEVFPVTTRWTDRSDVSWNDPWEDSGGDYSGEYMTSNFVLRSSLEQKDISVDVTEIVSDWQSGMMPNNGIIIKYSEADLFDMKSRYQVDERDIELEIYFSSSMEFQK